MEDFTTNNQEKIEHYYVLLKDKGTTFIYDCIVIGSKFVMILLIHR